MNLTEALNQKQSVGLYVKAGILSFHMNMDILTTSIQIQIWFQTSVEIHSVRKKAFGASPPMKLLGGNIVMH